MFNGPIGHEIGFNPEEIKQAALERLAKLEALPVKDVLHIVLQDLAVAMYAMGRTSTLNGKALQMGGMRDNVIPQAVRSNTKAAMELATAFGEDGYRDTVVEMNLDSNVFANPFSYSGR